MSDDYWAKLHDQLQDRPRVYGTPEDDPVGCPPNSSIAELDGCPNTLDEIALLMEEDFPIEEEPHYTNKPEWP
jgi:hypothetical protein